jgi:hypothetical protein
LTEIHLLDRPYRSALPILTTRSRFRTWRACRGKLKPNATGLAAVRFRVYVITGFNASVSGLFFD